jgi:integrase
LRTFLDRVAEGRLYAAYLLTATTGMRRGEVFGLRCQDVDLDAGQPSVRQTLIAPGYQLRFSTPKTAKGVRSIALDPTTVAVLRGQRKAQFEDRLACGPLYADTRDLVFTELDGSPVNPVRFSKQFEREVKGLVSPTSRCTACATPGRRSLCRLASTLRSCRSVSATRRSASRSISTPTYSLGCRKRRRRRSPASSSGSPFAIR